MSENHSTAVVLTKTSLEASVEVLGEALERLVAIHDFGFRGWGAALQLLFDGGRYDEDVIDEPLRQEDFNRATVLRLARTYRWFALEGSIRVPGVDRLCSLTAALCPTLDAENPACVVFRLDSWFLESVYGRDFNRFDEEAAERLTQLSIFLGAADRVDGFMTIRLPSLANLPMLDPDLIRERLATPWVGLVTGIKSAILSTTQIESLWPGARVLQTAHGFSVIDTMIDVAGEL